MKRYKLLLSIDCNNNPLLPAQLKIRANKTKNEVFLWEIYNFIAFYRSVIHIQASSKLLEKIWN